MKYNFVEKKKQKTHAVGVNLLEEDFLILENLASVNKIKASHIAKEILHVALQEIKNSK